MNKLADQKNNLHSLYNLPHNRKFFFEGQILEKQIITMIRIESPVLQNNMLPMKLLI
jgi:hypothetical protein